VEICPPLKQGALRRVHYDDYGNSCRGAQEKESPWP
jgi:hypothetical protein